MFTFYVLYKNGFIDQYSSENGNLIIEERNECLKDSNIEKVSKIVIEESNIEDEEN